MRKLFAMIATVAVVLSMFSGIAFAAPGATDATVAVTFKTGESKVVGEASVLEVVVTATNLVKYVNIDLGSTGFAVRGQGTSTWGATAAGVVSGNGITFTDATGITGGAAATFTIPVTNPSVVKAVTTGITVKTSDVVDGTAAVAQTVTATGLTTAYKVAVEPTSVIHNGVTSVTGTVTGFAASNVTLNWQLLDAASVVVAAGTTTDGTINLRQSFVNATNTLTSNYTLNVTDGTYAGTKTIAVKYNAVVDDFGTVNFNDTKTFSGKITDGAATPAGLVAKVMLVPNGWTIGNLIANSKGYTTTGADGSFVLTHKFTDSAKYDLVAWKDFTNAGTVDAGEAYAIKTFTVAARSMDVTVSGTAVANGAVDSVLTFAAKIGDTVHTTGSTFVVKDPSGATITAIASVHPTYTYRFTVAGTYTVEAVKAAGGTDSYKGTATFVVSAPDKVNVAVTAPTGDIYPNGSVNVTLNFVDKTGTGRVAGTSSAAQIKEVKYTVTGPIASSKTFDTTGTSVMTNANKDATVTVNIEQAGTLTIEGTVTMGDGSTVPFTKTLTVKGYLVTFTKTLGTIGDIVTLSTVVTTKDGTPVNNATVTYTLTDGFKIKDSNGDWVVPSGNWGSANALTIGPSAANINNGTYTKEVKLNTAGSVAVKVETPTPTTYAQWTATIDGSSVYTVTSTSSLIATNSGTLVINVKDASGNNVTTLTALTVSGAGISKTLNDASIVDTNNDGKLDSYQLAGIKATKAGDVVITASTDNGAKIGKLTVGATAPVATHTPADKVLTENVKETVTVDLTDVYSNIDLQGILKVTGVGATLDGIFLGSSTTSETITSNAYQFASGRSFTFKAVAYDVVESTPVAPQLKLEVSYDGGATYAEIGRIDIKPLVITVSPEKMSVGSLNRVDINVKDAHGNAYADKGVELLGSEGTTDEDGNVTMFITVNSTGTAKVNVNTSRTNVYTVKKVPVTYTAPTTPVKTVLEGSSVERKGEFIFVQIRQFEDLGAKLTWDAATKTATFVAGGKTVEVTVGSTVAKVNGVAATMPSAPINVGGRVMVPTRFIAEALGWKVDWAAGDIVTITLP